MQQFIDYIESHTNLLAGEVDKVISNIETETIKKNGFLLKEGELCKYNYFILKGCFRIYLINDLGKEQILHFAIENWWITDLAGFLNEKKARFYIQALENSEVVRISYKKYNFLISEIPSFETFIRIIFQQSFVKLQEHFIDTLNSEGETRYLTFVKKYPQMVQRIPQYMIASYLGLSAEFVSKIRRKLHQ